ncbi:MAG: hypothetical protein ACAI38_00465 [Myxococcota bacterium]|nr:hypothetical protein [Myxococcota bacterium]
MLDTSFTQRFPPNSIDVKRPFMDTVWQSSETETVARNIVIIARKDGAWRPFSEQDYESGCQHVTTPRDYAVLRKLGQGGYLDRDGERYRVNDLFIRVLSRWLTPEALAPNAGEAVQLRHLDTFRKALAADRFQVGDEGGPVVGRLSVRANAYVLGTVGLVQRSDGLAAVAYAPGGDHELFQRAVSVLRDAAAATGVSFEAQIGGKSPFA